MIIITDEVPLCFQAILVYGGVIPKADLITDFGRLGRSKKYISIPLNENENRYTWKVTYKEKNDFDSIRPINQLCIPFVRGNSSLSHSGYIELSPVEVPKQYY